MVSDFITSTRADISVFFDIYLSKILSAVLLLIVWLCISILVYQFVRYIFRRFKIIEFLDRLDMDFEDSKIKKKEKKKLSETFGKKIMLDIVVAKSISYYIFLVFFRYAVVIIGITDIEEFMSDLLAYLPSLFIAFFIWFFGIRFANFIYDVIHQSLKLTKQKTGKIIASGAKVIVLFFTLMAVLAKVGIATEITTLILTGFVAMLTIAGGLAFGLGGKDIARDILESFKK